MLIRPFFIVLFLGMWGVQSTAQNVISSLGSPAYHFMRRMEIRHGAIDLHHPGIMPYERQMIADQALFTSRQAGLSKQDISDLQYLFDDNNAFVPDTISTLYPALVPGRQSRNPIFRTFYRTPANLFEVNEKAFFLRVNPILDLAYGNIVDDASPYFINRRGAEVYGGIDRKVYFFANILETQVRYPNYIRQWVAQFESLPDAGLFKNYESDLFNFTDGYDYLASNGYVGFNLTKHIGMQLGHGKNFIGQGYRSLFLSDFSKNYFYLKFNTRVWKFHYQNIFGELGAREKDRGDDLVPKKYFAAHYLSLKIAKNAQVGVFEAVIFGRDDNGFELQYLNPIILYRSVEHHIGSPDNVVLGMDFRWDLFKRFRLYGQLLFDELKVGELFSDRLWWGNKFGYQLGLHYINAGGIDHLDLTVELNKVRPYTYSHRDSLGSYTHFNQPLAHPVGANFTEYLLMARYQPAPRWIFQGRFFYIRSGEDDDEENFGKNIVKPNTSRTGDFGIEHRQGIAVDQGMFEIQVNYMLRHNLFLDLKYFYRKYDSGNDQNDLDTQFISAGLRYNFYPLRLNF